MFGTDLLLMGQDIDPNQIEFSPSMGVFGILFLIDIICLIGGAIWLLILFVKKGDKINANDEIGIVFTNESTGKTVLKFNIFNELKPENPTIWLDKY